MSFGVLKNIGEGGMSKILRFPSLSYIVKTKNFGFCIVDLRFALWARGFTQSGLRRSAFFLCAGGGSVQT